MKRTIWVFSLAMLIFSIFTSSFTYALEPEEEQAIEFLNNTLEETMNWFKSPKITSISQQWEDNYLTFWLNENRVIFNPNWWAFSWMGINEIKEYKYETDNNWIKPIYNTKIPNRESEDISQQSGWMFAWWYTKSWDNNDWWEEFDLSNPNSSIAYAKWLPFNDLNVKIWDYTITIMDRNLWALQTAKWDYFWNWSYENSNKLWNLYQFWNSYWFKNIPNTFVSNSHSQGNKITIPEEIEPLWENDNYYSFNIFIKIANRWYEWNHKNLWWADDITNNDNERKWPCPTGYHIPSQDERKIIYSTLIKTNECTWDLEQKWKCIAKKLRLPYAWKINIYSPNNWKIMNQGSDSYYLNSRGGRMTFDNSSVYPEAGWAEAQWGSIRCFKDHNLSKEIKFDTNWWEFNDWEKIQDIEYQRIWQIYEPQESLKIPVKTWWMFAWWYTTSWDWNWENQTEEIDIGLASNTTAYAKWLPFNDLDLWIIWLEWIRIMDRNLWAEEVATGILYNTNQWHEDYNRLWYYYQRWNSYWFDTKNNLSYTNNIKINWSLFWPQMNYYSYIYKQINDNSISYISNDRSNVWWWKETLNNDKDKQWPCPIWYHVPDKDEFNAIINKFNTLKENEWFCNNTNEKECFAEKLKLPFAWYKWTDYPSYGYEWNYWTSSPSWLYTYKLWVNKYNLNVGATTDTNLYSIRCFKNNDKPIVFQTNWWNKLEGEYYTLRWRENKDNKITLPWISFMKKDWYTFKGRYTTSWFEGWTEVTNNDIITNGNEVILYAKWEKHPEITLKSNWWKFTDWTEEKILKANEIFKKRLQNENYAKSIVRKVAIFTWAESIHLSWSWIQSCVQTLNIYNCDKVKNNECNIYNQINANCWWKWCFFTDEDIPWDTITIEAETWSCNDAPKFDFIATAKWKDYYKITDEIPNIQKNWYEFLWWYEEKSNSKYSIKGTPITEDKTLYAKWKALKEKTEETATENVVYTNNTTVTVWEQTTEEVLSWSITLKLVSEEVKEQEVTKEEDKTTVKESEIKVTSDKKVEYEWWLEVYLEKIEDAGTENETTGKVEWTIKFSAPIAVKIPVASDVNYVKVQVKHWNEDFGFKGLTLNPVNECNNWEAVNDKYNWEDVEVKENNWERYATIYTCSASTFVAYTETQKPTVSQPSSGKWRPIKQTIVVTEEEHNSAATEEVLVEETSKNSKVNESVEQKVKKIEWKTLTRWEVAVMTNILLDVYPKLTENRSLNEVSEACENYADEQDFTKDEKKAITRLCKLSIMWIHNDNNEPLEEFLVKQKASNWEFAIVMDRVVSSYNEKDLSTIKEALKKLENDDEGVVFGTVYNVFMSIKNIFN